MAYSTVAKVKGTAILDSTFTQAGWTTDAPVDDRIAEADAVIDGRLAAVGFTLSDISSTVPLVNKLSILYSRYAILRDIMDNRGPSQASNEGGGGKVYLDQFETLMKAIEEGRAFLVNSSGAVLSPAGGGVQNAANGVEPIFTMGDPNCLSQTVADEYSDDDIKGVP